MTIIISSSSNGTTDFTEWYQDILPEVPGANAELCLHHIRRTLIEFCEETQSLQEIRDDIVSISGESDYTIESATPLVYDFINLISVHYDGQILQPTNEPELDSNRNEWYVLEGTPFAYYRSNLSTLRLFPIPIDDDDVIRIRFAVAPTASSTSIDTDFFKEYRSGIAAGVLARLLRMNKKPWTDLQLSAFYEGKHEEAKAQAKLATWKSYTNRSMEARPRSFGGLPGRTF